MNSRKFSQLCFPALLAVKRLAFAYAVLSFSDFGTKGPFAIGRAKSANQADRASRERVRRCCAAGLPLSSGG